VIERLNPDPWPPIVPDQYVVAVDQLGWQLPDKRQDSQAMQGMKLQRPAPLTTDASDKEIRHFGIAAVHGVQVAREPLVRASR
jgi:hypothetical protein